MNLLPPKKAFINELDEHTHKTRPSATLQTPENLSKSQEAQKQKKSRYNNYLVTQPTCLSGDSHATHLLEAGICNY